MQPKKTKDKLKAQPGCMNCFCNCAHWRGSTLAIYKTVQIIFPLNLQTITITLDVVKWRWGGLKVKNAKTKICGVRGGLVLGSFVHWVIFRVRLTGEGDVTISDTCMHASAQLPIYLPTLLPTHRSVSNTIWRLSNAHIPYAHRFSHRGVADTIWGPPRHSPRPQVDHWTGWGRFTKNFMKWLGEWDLVAFSAGYRAPLKITQFC